MQLLKRLLTITSLYGCVGAPVKPSITLCVVDIPRMQGICGETSFQSVDAVSKLTYNNIVSEILLSKSVRRVPIESLDKSVCQAPSEWEKSENYLQKLEDYANERCTLKGN